MGAQIVLSSSEALALRYLARHGSNDLDGVLELFAEDATVEDPVGTPVLRGRSAIREFYATAHARNGRIVFERVGPVLAGGDEIALHVQARLARDADGQGMDVIYTVRVDGDGRIRSLRAYF